MPAQWVASSPIIGAYLHPGFSVFSTSCGRAELEAWEFDHLVASQSSLTPFHWSTDASAAVDVLFANYEAYIHERRAAGSEQISD